jgi:DNA-binding HxlR family transcriptional regulator
MRAGAYGLSLLSNPLNARLLRALEEEPLALADLHRRVGLPAQTTLRGYLRTLVEVDVVERHRKPGFPGGVSYELTRSGRDLVAAGRILEEWLAASPGGALHLGDSGAKGAVKALADGWSTKVLRALAAKPLSLTELDRLIPSVNYPALERRLGAMSSAGQVRMERGSDGSKPYKVTDWLRTAVAPLLAAADWEQAHTPDAAEPFDRLDAEATFLLAVPMLELTCDQRGACQLAIELGDEVRSGGAGVVVEIREGRPAACRSDKKANAFNEAVGSKAAWLGALLGVGTSSLRIRGDAEFVNAIVMSIRSSLAQGGRS